LSAGQGLAVADIAQKILTSVVAHFKTAPQVSLPKRQFIAPGNPRLIAWDAEQLYVAMSGIGLGSAPTEPAFAQRTGNPISASGIRHAVFEVQLVRCVPESQDGTNPPDPAVITTAGLALMRDAGLLSQALVEACSTVSAALAGLGSVQPGAVEILGPEGGMAACAGSIAVSAGNLA